ncbi:hypothetical protein AMK22_35530 [Streptomyces sp. CB01580]|nr:hypothetical protein AMK22_35530 [Streptomyces sp. CB01580]
MFRAPTRVRGPRFSDGLRTWADTASGSDSFTRGGAGPDYRPRHDRYLTGDLMGRQHNTRLEAAMTEHGFTHPGTASMHLVNKAAITVTHVEVVSGH